VFTAAQFSAAALAIAVLIAPAAPQQARTTEQLRSRFSQEADPVHKTKLLLPLGDSEFRDAQAALAEGKNSEALDILKQYLDEAQSCDKALDAKFADPERHPNGFKQLQISVREALRRLGALIVGLSADDRGPFVDIRNQLDEMDRHLIQQLFPRQPAAPQKPKG
jgi:hypothetical protein